MIKKCPHCGLIASIYRPILHEMYERVYFHTKDGTEMKRKRSQEPEFSQELNELFCSSCNKERFDIELVMNNGEESIRQMEQ